VVLVVVASVRFPPSRVIAPTGTASASVSVLAVTVAAIWSPTITVRALVLSCALVIVSVSVEMAVTRTISAVVLSGFAAVGQMVALNGTAGNKAPCPAVTTSDVPLAAGEGAVATKL